MKKVITFGEIMLRLATPDYQRFSQATNLNANFGGGEANVAIALAQYGIDSYFVTRLPKNDIAQWCVSELKKYGVKTDNILYGGDRMGIYFFENGAVSRASKVIYDRAYSAMSTIQAGMVDWKQVLQGAEWFHFTGITAAISQSAADACLEAVEVASKMGITISCDMSYRQNLWQYGKGVEEIMPAMVAKSTVFIGNEMDAQKVFGIEPEKKSSPDDFLKLAEYESIALQLMKKYPAIKIMSTTRRGQINASHNTWAGCLFDGKQMYHSQSYDISHIVDRVGGGDAYMGGLIYGMIHYKNDYQQALEFSIAAGCLKHTIYGDFNLSSVQEIENLMNGNFSGRIQR